MGEDSETLSGILCGRPRCKLVLPSSSERSRGATRLPSAARVEPPSSRSGASEPAAGGGGGPRDTRVCVCERETGPRGVCVCETGSWGVCVWERWGVWV